MITSSAYFGPLFFEHNFQRTKPYECSMGKVSECLVEVVEHVSGKMTQQSSAMKLEPCRTCSPGNWRKCTTRNKSACLPVM